MSNNLQSFLCQESSAVWVRSFIIQYPIVFIIQLVLHFRSLFGEVTKVMPHPSSHCGSVGNTRIQEHGGRFKNTYELLNLRALKHSPVNKIHIIQCMGEIFCVEFQRYPLKFHTKYPTHTLKDVIFIQYWNFKSSYAFLNAHQDWGAITMTPVFWIKITFIEHIWLRIW